jgi:hypothetical protein
MSEVTEQHLEDIDALFVQVSAGLTSGEGTVTLRGLAPSTLYFADRPKREVGHMSTRRFVDLWDEGEDSFAIDPPNAVLSYAENDEEVPEDAVVVLLDPRLEGNDITYGVEVLEGELPAKASHCALFIDTFGRPLTPVSAAGMHRRERRRERRRF